MLTSFSFGTLILIVDSLNVTVLLSDHDRQGPAKFHRFLSFSLIQKDGAADDNRICKLRYLL